MLFWSVSDISAKETELVNIYLHGCVAKCATPAGLF